MRTGTTQCIFKVPSRNEWVVAHPQKASSSTARALAIFDFLSKPGLILQAVLATEAFEMPPITGVALALNHEFPNLSIHERQTIGSILCLIMELNGYSRTGRKRSIGFKPWSKGELYRRKESRIHSLVVFRR